MLYVHLAKPEEEPGDDDKPEDVYQVHPTKSQLSMGTVCCH